MRWRYRGCNGWRDSFGIYIIHGPIWLLLSWVVIATYHVHTSTFALRLAYLTLTVAVAGLSFTYLERPARRYIRARWAATPSRLDLLPSQPWPILTLAVLKPVLPHAENTNV